jgi:hypothetical protein
VNKFDDIAWSAFCVLLCGAVAVLLSGLVE